MSLTLKLALSPLLAAQAVLTRARLPRLAEAEGARSGREGQGPVLRLLVAGDSSAAGVGVTGQHQALALQLARRLAEQRQVQVHWQLLAQSGLTTAGTLALLQAQAGLQADVGMQKGQVSLQADLGMQKGQVSLQADLAVIVTGVNDIVDQVPSHHAVAHREALADWLLSAAGVQHVAFAPLPPVHAFPGLPQPLRWVAGADARRHNAALRDWAATRQDLSMVDMALPLAPENMARDGFHPGAPVYWACAEAIARHLAALAWRAEPA